MTMPLVVEVAISLAFLYLMLAVGGSALHEYLAQRQGWRGRFMRTGLRRLISDRWIYMALIRHPSVAALYREEAGRPKPPSYVPPESFATALLDVVLNKARSLEPATVVGADTDVTVQDYARAAEICGAHGYAIGNIVQPICVRAQELENAKEMLAAWYDSAMNRVSGDYKRSAQYRLFLIGLLIALVFNIDSISIGSHLFRSPESAAAIADLATQTLCEETGGDGSCALPATWTADSAADFKMKVAEQLGNLDQLADAGLPIGYACLGSTTSTVTALTRDFGAAFEECRGYWRDEFTAWSIGEIFFRIFGWLITAAAISFGAEFWFAFIVKFINLRGSGPKPQSAS
jgi:hypothetical protein